MHLCLNILNSGMTIFMYKLGILLSLYLFISYFKNILSVELFDLLKNHCPSSLHRVRQICINIENCKNATCMYKYGKDKLL